MASVTRQVFIFCPLLDLLLVGRRNVRKSLEVKLKHQLPPLYRAILPQTLLEADYSEKSATCDDCSMSREKRGASARLVYDPTLKCCTFEPFVPNYLAGGLFNEASRFPNGVTALRKKIANREYALPIGLLPSVRFQVEFNQREKGDFGNRPDWICPYFQKDTQNCGIWKYRGTVCTTFFCQSDHGARGQRFWGHLSDLLAYVEMALMEETLVELDFSPRQVSACVDYLNRQEGRPEELLSHALEAKKWKELWNGYDSGIEEFYKKCHAKVLSWDRERVEEIMGDWGARLEKKTGDQLRRLTEGSHAPERKS